MARRDYLTMADVIAIHKIQIHKYGGAAGIRDYGALESALFRPMSGYYNDLTEEAAAMMESLAMNHPFIDGNKRVAFAATDVFLRINNAHIVSRNDDIYKTMITMFNSNTFDFEHIVVWLKGVIKEPRQ